MDSVYRPPFAFLAMLEEMMRNYSVKCCMRGEKIVILWAIFPHRAKTKKAECRQYDASPDGLTNKT